MIGDLPERDPNPPWVYERETLDDDNPESEDDDE